MMGKLTTNIVKDAYLNAFATATQLVLCVGEPANRAQALATALSTVTLAPADFTKTTVGTSRRVTIAKKDLVPITESGIVDHAALITGADLLAATTVTPKQLDEGDAVSIPAFSSTIDQPL